MKKAALNALAFLQGENPNLLRLLMDLQCVIAGSAIITPIKSVWGSTSKRYIISISYVQHLQDTSVLIANMNIACVKLWLICEKMGFKPTRIEELNEYFLSPM